MTAFEIMSREWGRMPAIFSGAGNMLALAFVAVALPFAKGDTFLEPCYLIAFAMLSVLMVASVITTSFYGQEARQDLRELTARGVTAGALSLGKAGAAAMRGWLLGMAVLVIGLLTVILGRGLRFPSTALFGQAAALSLTGSWVVAFAGALISLRASSVRQAQDRIKVMILVAILAACDVIWFYPGDLLEVPSIGFIAAVALVAAAGVLCRRLRKQLGDQAASGKVFVAGAIQS